MKRSKNIFCRRLSSRQHFMHEKFNKPKNKRNLSADSSLLLLSALRPRLLRIRIFGTMPIRLSTLKVRKSGLRYAMPMAIITFIVAGCAANSLITSSNASAASITLTVPSKISLDITPGPNGVFKKSEPGNINVKTDNSSGYTLSIKAKNSENSNALLNGSNKINSISEQTSEDNFRTNAKFNNTWGFLPSKFNNKDNTNFIPGSTAEESIIEITAEADNETGVNYNIALGAKVDNSIASGDYSNNFIFSAITNEPKYDAIMQDWAENYNNCENLSTEQVVNLLDKRDNNIYKVAKLKDGKCWMVENLRLGDDKLQNRTLTSNDTDITDSTYQLTEQTPEDFNAYTGGYLHYNVDALYIDSAHPEYGGYYSWHTATAGTGTSSMRHPDNAPSSICPKGWKLPTGSYDNDFENLVTAYGGDNSTGSTNLRATPVPNFIYSGELDNNIYGQRYVGSRGRYWSSTAASTQDAYNLFLDRSSASFNNLPPRYNGLSVRCLIEPKKTMQTVDLWGQDLGEEETVKAADIRDGNIYNVARLKDGKLWMTQNLRLGDEKLIDRNIKAEDSDFTTDQVPSGTINIPSSTNKQWNFSVYDKSMFYSNNDTEYGGLYTWYLATAEEGTSNKSSGDVSRSICPKGWHLPTQQETSTLSSTYNYSQAQTDIPNFGAVSWAGYCNQNGCPYGQGFEGYWWSSTARSTDYAYDLRSSSSYFSLNNLNKGHGFSVRCVSEPLKIMNLQYLQDWNNLSETEKKQATDSMDETHRYQLIDKRDGNIYTVAKLKDGVIWMTDNLRLGDEKLVNRNIKVEDSDFTIEQVPSGTINIPEVTKDDWDNTTYDKSMVFIYNTYGGYYTWYLATAEEGTSSKKSGDTSRSICPKGWRLPTQQEITALTEQYDYTTSKNVPANFKKAGSCYSPGCPYQSGRYGYWWSSTASSTGTAHSLILTNSSFSSTYSGSYKGTGYSIRCVAR